MAFSYALIIRFVSFLLYAFSVAYTFAYITKGVTPNAYNSPSAKSALKDPLPSSLYHLSQLARRIAELA